MSSPEVPVDAGEPLCARPPAQVPRIPTPRTKTNVACLSILGIVLAVFAYQGLIDNDTGGLKEIQDYVITWSFSERVVVHHSYFRDFTYALPAVVFKVLFAKPGLELTSIIWMALLIAAAFAVARAFIRLLGREGSDDAYLAPLLAFGTVLYSVQWDYRAVNTNTLFLALILWSLVYMQRRRPGLAGFLLATSISLKLYSVVLLPYLLFYHRREVVSWTCGWIVFYFVLVPGLYFGPVLALELTGKWVETILNTSDREFVVDLIAYKVSLYHVLLSLFHFGGEEAMSGAPKLVRLSLDSVFYLTRCIQGSALVALALYLARERGHACRLGSDRRLLVDAGLLLQLMLLLSPLLEPHHPVLLLIPAVVLADVALDRDERPRWRALAVWTMALCALGVKVAPSGVYKGVAINASIVGLGAVIVYLRSVVRQREAASPAGP